MTGDGQPLGPGACRPRRDSLVTSERGSVYAVDATQAELLARMDDGLLQHFGRDDPGPRPGPRLRPHHESGPWATVDWAHALEDGGGRELTYVKMSRAREHSTVYAVVFAPVRRTA